LPAILNESVAHELFGAGNALGKRVRDDKQSYEAIMYVPLTQRDLKSIDNKVSFVDPRLSIFYAQTLGGYLDRSRSALQFSVQTYRAIGIFGLALAAIGLPTGSKPASGKQVLPCRLLFTYPPEYTHGTAARGGAASLGK
jgi:hypothetical protein